MHSGDVIKAIVKNKMRSTIVSVYAEIVNHKLVINLEDYNPELGRIHLRGFGISADGVGDSLELRVPISFKEAE